MVEKIEISIEHAKSIYKVLEDHVSMGFAIVSQEIKDIVSEDAYKKLTDIFYKYHNANCGPFNRALKRLIEEVEVKIKENLDIMKRENERDNKKRDD